MQMNQSILYMRYLKLLVLLLVSFSGFAQAPTNYTNINGRYRWIAGMFDSTFSLPKGATPSLRVGGSNNPGAIFYNTSDSSVYTYTGTQWIKVRGSLNPSDTTNKYVTQVYKKSGSDSVFYVKGGVHTFAFNDSTGAPGGGGGGKVYYFNGGVSMGTFGGFQMYELGDTANTGSAANFTRSTTGNIANFITDPNKPGLLQIPAGVWTIDAWMSEAGGGSNHAEIWAVLEKWNGSTITTIATSPIEQITEGNSPNLYTWAITVPTTPLAVTDRIIIQFYITNTNGKTVTLYTQNGYVGEVHTTFTTGIGALNGLTAPAQYLVTGTSGNDFNISSATATHTFNLPTASATNRGALSSADWTTFNNKVNISDTATMLSPYVNNVGYGLLKSGQVVRADSATLSNYYLRRKDSLTSTNLLGYVTRKVLADTASAIRSADAGGTVTSVATNNGTGITGGTITTNGTLSIDTLRLSTRAWRQKGIDSVQANLTAGLATKLNISDTASMLSPYARTNVVNAGLALKVNISDTASMLTPYLRKVDTTAMLNPYLRSNVAAATYVPQTRTITINGTSQDLSANRTYNVGTVTQVSSGVGLSGGPITTSGTLSVDTLLMSTRAWRQKGIDSVAALANTKIGGSGTAYTLPRFTGTNSIGNSNFISDVAGNLGIGLIPSDWASFPSIELGNIGSIGFQGAYGNIASNLYFNTSWKYATSSGAALLHQLYDGQFQWYSSPQGMTGQSALLNLRMTLDANGNLGVGNSLADSMLMVNLGTHLKRGVRMSGLPTGVGTKAVRINANGTLSVADTLANGVAGTGTTNYIPKFTGASAIGNSTMQESSGSFLAGSATASGAGVLTIAIGNTTGGALKAQDTNGASVEMQAAGTLGYIGTTTNHDMLFLSNDAERMRLTTSGNLGLGVTPSAWSVGGVLQVANTTGIKPIASSGVYNGLSANLYYNAGWKYATTGNALLYSQEAGTHAWYNAISGTAGNAASLTQAMTLDASGNLGIGTTSPAYKLDVNGAGRYIFRNSSNEIMDLLLSTESANSISKLSLLWYGNETAAIKFGRGVDASGGTLSFWTQLEGGSTSERMRITSGGEVYIAGTTDQGAYNLQVNGTGVWGAGAYVNGSDIRLKENIKEVGSALNLVNQLKPKTYTYKSSYSSDTATQVGFIAQDLEEVLKNEVYKNSIVVEGKEYKSVAYQNLIPLLVKAIQEQQIEIEKLKKQIK